MLIIPICEKRALFPCTTITPQIILSEKILSCITKAWNERRFSLFLENVLIFFNVNPYESFLYNSSSVVWIFVPLTMQQSNDYHDSSVADSYVGWLYTKSKEQMSFC